MAPLGSSMSLHVPTSMNAQEKHGRLEQDDQGSSSCKATLPPSHTVASTSSTVISSSCQKPKQDDYGVPVYDYPSVDLIKYRHIVGRLLHVTTKTQPDTSFNKWTNIIILPLMHQPMT
eukprot:TRINITY_DN19302_c0_g1_i1.p1 TRINITY_DN19302_c0_g1~~TRINITY_DN19302_c0_g1_i1.p1  ORF type:complete len:118 (-),score=7.23 TRINITY_DN19302_c0_g1_i1:191-544(-)